MSPHVVVRLSVHFGQAQGGKRGGTSSGAAEWPGVYVRSGSQVRPPSRDT
ncbi:hypothetical protein ACX6XY_18670 [Streptomyces sp. O3]